MIKTPLEEEIELIKQVETEIRSYPNFSPGWHEFDLHDWKNIKILLNIVTNPNEGRGEKFVEHWLIKSGANLVSSPKNSRCDFFIIEFKNIVNSGLEIKLGQAPYQELGSVVDSMGFKIIQENFETTDISCSALVKKLKELKELKELRTTDSTFFTKYPELFSASSSNEEISAAIFQNCFSYLVKIKPGIGGHILLISEETRQYKFHQFKTSDLTVTRIFNCGFLISRGKLKFNFDKFFA